MGILGAELKLVVGIEQAMVEATDNAVVLVDEADKLFVDDVKGTLKRCKACIGFTATIPSGREGEVVQSRLENLKFEIWRQLGYQHDEFDVDVEVADIEEFFAVAKRGAKLVFCSAG